MKNNIPARLLILLGQLTLMSLATASFSGMPFSPGVTAAALPQNASSQHMAVPAYFYPGPLWQQMDKGATTVGAIVMNPNNGPGSSCDPQYAQAVKAAQQAGIRVVGYVYTSYGKRSPGDVETDINAYYSCYSVDGIFLDEAYSNDCSQLSYYQQLYTYIKAQPGKDMVIINPGTQNAQSQCYMAVTDVMVNFEGSYAQYLNSYPSESWNNHYPPNRFWHISYCTPTVADMQNAIALSETRHASRLYVTDDCDSNVYDQLPSYWSPELKALRQ